MPDFDYARYENAFVARQLHKLRELITSQSDDCFFRAGILAPSHTTSTLLQLATVGSSSISGLAETLGYSHQLINHRLVQLEQIGFVERIQDSRDKRRCLIRLTAEGQCEVAKIQHVLPRISDALGDLFDEIGIDLLDGLSQARRSLSQHPIAERIDIRPGPPVRDAHPAEHTPGSQPEGISPS